MTRFRRKSAAPNLVRIIPVWHSGPACQKTLPLYIIHDTCFQNRATTLIVFYIRTDNTLRVCECPNDGHELFCGMAENCLIYLLNIDGHRSTPPIERSWRRMSTIVRRPTHMTRRAQGRVSWFSVHLSCFYPSVVIGVSSAVAPSEPEAARDVAVSARLNRCHSVGDIPVSCLNLRTKYAGSS